MCVALFYLRHVCAALNAVLILGLAACENYPECVFYPATSRIVSLKTNGFMRSRPAFAAPQNAQRENYIINLFQKQEFFCRLRITFCLLILRNIKQESTDSPLFKISAQLLRYALTNARKLVERKYKPDKKHRVYHH